MLVRAHRVMDKLALFDTMRERIRRDVNLSPAGQERALKNLNESIKVYRTEAVRELRDEWKDARADFMDLHERSASAAAQVERAYDYSRLMYHRQTAQEQIKRAGDAKEAESTIRQAVATADKDKRRGWLETWPAVAERYGGNGGGGLAAWMQDELSKDMRPVTQNKLDADRDVLLPGIVELKEITDSVVKWYGAMSWMGIVDDDFRDITAGVSISSRFVDGLIKTTIDFEDAPAPITASAERDA